MYEHLKTWTEITPEGDLRLDLWDTGRTRDGKSELRYALAFVPKDLDTRPVVFDGEEFWPAPSIAIDSDESAAALLDFFASYGESIRWSGDDADVPEYTPRQREVLAAQYENLSVWSQTLEGEGA